MENNELWTECRAIRDSLEAQGREMTELRTLVRSSLATREWVVEELKPIRDVSIRTEQAMQQMSLQMGELAVEVKNSYAQQDQLMKERAEGERMEREARIAALEKRTLMNIIKDHGTPIGAFILTGAGVLALLGETIKQYISYVVHLPK